MPMPGINWMRLWWNDNVRWCAFSLLMTFFTICSFNLAKGKFGVDKLDCNLELQASKKNRFQCENVFHSLKWKSHRTYHGNLCRNLNWILDIGHVGCGAHKRLVVWWRWEETSTAAAQHIVRIGKEIRLCSEVKKKQQRVWISASEGRSRHLSL